MTYKLVDTPLSAQENGWPEKEWRPICDWCGENCGDSEYFITDDDRHKCDFCAKEEFE